MIVEQNKLECLHLARPFGASLVAFLKNLRLACKNWMNKHSSLFDCIAVIQFYKTFFDTDSGTK